MTTNPSITIQQLRNAIDRVLNHVEGFGLSTVTPQGIDEYWLISESDRHKMHVSPPLSVGSYVDDIAEVSELAEDKERPPMVLDLDRLASLFQLLSFQLIPTEPS